jgi:hypothetical protein
MVTVAVPLLLLLLMMMIVHFLGITVLFQQHSGQLQI